MEYEIGPHTLVIGKEPFLKPSGDGPHLALVSLDLPFLLVRLSLHPSGHITTYDISDSMRKRVLIRLLIGTILVVVGFVGGRIFQHAKTGYHFTVREEKKYDSSMGQVGWSYVSESIGSPFLDPGTTIIEYNGRTIYKAQRAFQERFPFAQNIVISNRSIAWDDGELLFHLTIETNIPPKKSP